MTRASGRTSRKIFGGRVLVPGRAQGRATVLEDPLSFWGGLDPTTGVVIDRRHPQAGVSVIGRVLVMPGGRGSSSSSSVLAEAVHAGTAPAAILMLKPDAIVALGAMVGAEIYGASLPVVVLAEEDYWAIGTGDTIGVEAQEHYTEVRCL